MNTIVPISSLTPLASIDKSGAAQQQGKASGLPFADVLSGAMQNLQQTQEVSQQDSYDLALGNVDDLHTMQINSIKASAAVELTAGVTSRVLTAYNQIISMQI